MKKVGIAILGLGVVGGGVFKMISEHNELYKKAQNVDLAVECVLVRNRARAIDLGIDESKIAEGIAEVCSNSEIDIVVEAIGGIEPAKSYVLAALNAGKSVVTSNKELFCKYSHELEKTAKKNNCGLFYEATCGGGIPVVRALLDNLQGNKITSLIGIINGTTNYILTGMTDRGQTYEEALKQAQDLGFAEANPTADVDGYDATYKLSILSSLAFHTKIPYTQIHREGISGISPLDIQYGKYFGYVLKLLAIGKDCGKGIEVRVHPAFIKADHPLASVKDCYNAVYITGDCVEDVMLYGRGAGSLPTASAVMGDVIYCATHTTPRYSPFKNTEEADSGVKFITDFESVYYLRLAAEDRAGVLAKVMSIFGKFGISVAQVIQEKDATNGKVPLVVVTHVTRENNITRAVAGLNATIGIAKVASVIRVIS